MFLWRRTAELQWVKAHEDHLQAHAHGQLVIVRRPGRKRLQLEIVSRRRSDSSALLKEFGGRIEALPRNWLKRFARTDSKPIRIGRRLMIVRSVNEMRGPIEPDLLAIPASLAFGTGEHATTAVSLRFLEQLTHSWNPGWSLVDLGTGSGILAMAAKRFGAGRVIGIDNDPTAISAAKSNARLNKIHASFQSGDVRKWSPAQEVDVIMANLYSDLLIEILPKLGRTRWLILTGILRSQQNELVCALQRNHYDVISMKRRGKWMAFLARRSRHSGEAKLRGGKFLRQS